MREFNESIEQEPKHNIVIVDILRHGTTNYIETTMSDEEKLSLEKIPRDLTPEGEEEVRKTAEEIIKTINKETDKVVLISSPRWRAKGSMEIIKEVLFKNEINIAEEYTDDVLRNFDVRNKIAIDKITKLSKDQNKTTDYIFARDSEFQEQNDIFESQPEVKLRGENFFSNVKKIAEKTDLEGKRLRIISVSHFEVLNPIMEDVFDYRVDDNQGVKKGESMSFTFDFDKDSNKMSLSGDFRGEHIENISFDDNSKHFVLNSKK